METLAAWNAQGRKRPDGDDAALDEVQRNDKRVTKMIVHGYADTQAHISQIRNEIEVQRLELLAERQYLETQRAEMDYEKNNLDREKKEFEEKGAKLVAATAGQALLVENEVKRRLKEEKDR